MANRAKVAPASAERAEQSDGERRADFLRSGGADDQQRRADGRAALALGRRHWSATMAISRSSAVNWVA